jgi:steroid delta-isomerase-like uncharacterized protein
MLLTLMALIPKKGTQAMSTEQNKAIRRRFDEEIVNKKNLAALESFYAPNYVDHAAIPGFPPGVEGVKQRHAAFFAAFPDSQIALEDQIAEGDKVATRFTIRGTHTGEFFGIPPTGKAASVTGIDIMRIVDGKIAEYWGQMDMLGLMQQLGAVPAPGQAG